MRRRAPPKPAKPAKPPILPGLLRIRTGATPLAAGALVALTLCATVYQLLGGQPEGAAFAAAVGSLSAVVAYGRWRVAPLGEAPRRTELPATV